jgi:hypothetical protein
MVTGLRSWTRRHTGELSASSPIPRGSLAAVVSAPAASDGYCPISRSAESAVGRYRCGMFPGRPARRPITDALMGASRLRSRGLTIWLPWGLSASVPALRSMKSLHEAMTGKPSPRETRHKPNVTGSRDSRHRLLVGRSGRIPSLGLRAGLRSVLTS